MSSYLRPRRGKKSTAIAQLTSSNPLKRGEIFFEVPDDGVGTGAGKIKMGDGVTAYVDLPYFSEGGGDIGTVLTQAEYDALTPEQKANGTYWISDASGGSVVIDNTLDATSMNAIANKPVAEAITQLNNDLSVFSFRNNGGTAQYSMNSGSSWTNFKNPVGTKNIYSNGTYDVTNYASAYVSVSTSLSETTLWTNSSPTSNFINQSISLNNGISNYTYIKIYCRTETTDSTECYSIMKVSDFKNTTQTTNGLSLVVGFTRSNAHRMRFFNYSSDTSVYSSNGTYVSGTTTPVYGGNICVPTKITGMK